MTDKEYFAIDAISASFLKSCAIDTLAHAKYKADHPPASGDSARLGSGLHCYSLEPDTFLDRYACKPPVLDGRTKAGKEFAQDADAHNKTVLSADEFSLIQGMDSALRSHGEANALLFSEGGTNEIVLQWKEGALPARAKLDRILGSVIVDLKSAQNASQRGFSNAVFRDWRYDIQAAWYMRAARSAGHAIDSFVFVVVESKPPHAVAVYQMDQAVIDNADEEIDILLPRIAAARESGVWPAYPTSMQTLYLPAWMAGGVE